MSKLKVVKVDPLELSPHLTWAISGLLQISLKEFSVYVDEKENIMYVNKNLKIPKKDMDRLIEIATSTDIWLTDEQYEFLDYVYEHYGSSACSAVRRSHDSRKEKALKEKAEQQMKVISPIIEEELLRTDIDEMVLYEAYKAGSNSGRKSRYKLVGYDYNYTFMLGYLIGMGRVSADGVITIYNEEGEVVT